MKLALFGAALALCISCLPAHAQGGRLAACERRLEAQTTIAGMTKGQRIKRSQKLARCMERGGKRGEGRGMGSRRGAMMTGGPGRMRGEYRPEVMRGGMRTRQMGRGHFRPGMTTPRYRNQTMLNRRHGGMNPMLPGRASFTSH